MELPSNNAAEIETYFHSQLDEIYGKEEVKVFVKLIFNNILNINTLNINILNKSINILESEVDTLNKILQRLKKNEPLQYILGSTHFYGMEIKVNPSVLIPRPETEELVHLILNTKPETPRPERVEGRNPKPRIIDIGTGSGCIAIALKKNIPNALVTGIDISEEALQTAKQNSLANSEDVSFLLHDVLNNEPLPKADIIVSNPPYITHEEKQQMHKNVLEHEPHLALFVSNNDPLQFYKAITTKAVKSLSKGGLLFFELNPLYANEVLSLVKSAGFKQAQLIKDINGKNRILKAEL